MKSRKLEVESWKFAVPLAGTVIVLAAVAAYANGFSGPFLFLDVPAIVENPTIRHLWPIGRVLSPPSAGGLTVGGRPLVNLSLAVNYALGGTHVWGYHAFNLAVHILAGLTLFGIIRRTLLSTTLAFAIALLWTVHPLQTESVTWIVQRAESMMGLFYLLTLYGFIRYAESLEVGRRAPAPPSTPPELRTEGVAGARRPTLFLLLSVLACLLGMATKEVAVSAPVIVFLYDRTFVSGTFRGAWRRHGRLYAGLAATWILLAWLVAGTGGSRGGTSGFGLGVSWWDYALTQFPAVVHYLRLAVWPRGLDFHYGAQWVSHPWTVVPQATIVILLIGASAWGFLYPSEIPFTAEARRTRRENDPKQFLCVLRASAVNRAVGFCGIFFFAILAPTSLVPGMTQTMAEHRMYLALAPVIAVLICGGYALLERSLGFKPKSSRGHGLEARATTILSVAIPAVALTGIFLTARRNATYHSELALWADTTVKSPDNPYPFNNLGIALVNAGRRDEAVPQFTRALQLNPGYAEAHNNLGLALAGSGRLPEAMAEYAAALRLKPDYPEAETNLGVALAGSGRLPEAIERFSAAVRLNPDYAAAHNNLAVALAGSGRLPEAIAQYREMLRLEPGYSEVHYNLGNALLASGRLPEAITEYGAALDLQPDYPEAEANLGAALAEAGRYADAIAHYERALRLAPGDPDVRHNLDLARRALRP